MFRRAETHKCRIGFDKLVSSQALSKSLLYSFSRYIGQTCDDEWHGYHRVRAQQLTRNETYWAEQIHNLITVHLALITPFCHTRPATHAYFLTSSGVGPTGALDAAKLH